MATATTEEKKRRKREREAAAAAPELGALADPQGNGNERGAAAAAAGAEVDYKSIFMVAFRGLEKATSELEAARNDAKFATAWRDPLKQRAATIAEGLGTARASD